MNSRLFSASVRTTRLRAALALGAILFLAGCGEGISGNGVPAEEARELPAFRSIESKSSLDVSIEPADSFRVELRIDSNLIDLVTTRVRDGRLVIDTLDPVEDLIRGPHARVYLPALDAASLSGSGFMKVAAFEATDELWFGLSGSGEIVAEAQASLVRADLDGSGEIDLDGAADRVELDLSGSGSIDAHGLPAAEGAVDLSGSGEVAATLSDRVDIDLSGSGTIDLFGTAEIEQYSKSGSGHVRRH